MFRTSRSGSRPPIQVPRPLSVGLGDVLPPALQVHRITLPACGPGPAAGRR